MTLRMSLLALISLLLLADPAHARSLAAPTTSNAEMTRLYNEDQSDREPDEIDWDKVTARDEQRRLATRALLTAGALHTAEDYEHAAFIFQHGSKADDYLLAHTLAMVAVGKGDKSSLWIASATLDRYLMMIGKPQVYGTQFRGSMGQEPYDRNLVSDALRSELGVPALARQAEQLEALRAARAAAVKP
ncbi:hypothetical protein [Caulobacter sp. 602-1]|uniref:hypothetical protein n=1 Tax=Caulobacter sp. 602-1 TaxID=2492472 RepID=UPI001F33FD84|nr:hypothetical protein [Caulobacter sp. 602-1]